eukprot:gnl/TRDRNA2_/TRDRNA2_80153_c0_seq1.p1 gnl/TRDRNA2_/TRDRNA2_80153_c0~~gnl/TRDRNA2_/TRDRNA2_80153_c0_seq1.p1  ORF type:complete len:327 (+),score=49.52 gnl/TRDRNA2_/TRDRNA2_80153_c0_seq1:50-1030(+)
MWLHALILSMLALAATCTHEEGCNSCTASGVGDDMSLLQVNLKADPVRAVPSSDHQAPVHSTALKRQPQPPTTPGFPAKIRNLALVAIAQKKISMLGLQMHPYDVGLYVDVESPLWGKKNLTVDGLLNTMQGHAMLRYRCLTPSYRGLFQGQVQSLYRQSLMDFLKDSANMTNHGSPTAIAEYAEWEVKTCLTAGSIHTVYLDEDGVRTEIDGVSTGAITNASHLSRAILNMYQKEDVIPGFVSGCVDHLRQWPWKAPQVSSLEENRRASIDSNPGGYVWTPDVILDSPSTIETGQLLVLIVLLLVSFVPVFLCIWIFLFHREKKR